MAVPIPQLPGMFGPTAPPGGNLFMNMVAQQGGSPLFTGYNARGGQTAGMIPQLGMLNMFTQPMIHRMLANMGMVPGQFAGTQNLYDQQRQTTRFKNQFEAINRGAQRDIPIMTDAMVGLGSMLGINMGAREQGTAAGMAGHLAKLTPWIAQMAPDMLDKLHGSRGSAAVLARGIAKGGRYAIDPVSRLHETSLDTIDEFSKSIEAGADDPGSDLHRYGISRGQAGLMYEELSQRGLMGVRSIGLQNRQQRIQTLADDDPTMDVTDIKNLGDDAMATKLRQFDASRIKSRLEGMSGAVDAMREIFGDMGNPNAPMSQIIDGLNALTQGGLSSMPVSELERMVRDTKSVAELSGVGIDAMMALTAQAAQIGDKFGINRSLAPLAAQQGALAGRASADAGWAGVYGSLSPEEVAVGITRSRSQFVASATGKGLTAFWRTREELTDSGEFATGSRAQQLYEATQRGDTEFEGQAMDELLANRGAMRDILSDSGLNQGALRQYGSFLADNFGNQRYAQENQEAFGRAARNLQGVDMGRAVMSRATGMALTQQLVAGGYNEEDSVRITSNVAMSLSKEIWADATSEDMENTTTWRAFVDEKARPMLLAEGMTDAQIDSMMPSLAAGIQSHGNLQAADLGFKGLAAAVELFGGAAVGQQQRLQIIARQNTQISTALAPLKSRGPLRNFMDAIMEGDQPITQIIGKVLGGISTADLKEPLAEAFEEMTSARQELDAAETEEDREEATELLRDAERRIDAFARVAPGEAKEVRELQEFIKGDREIGDLVVGDDVAAGARDPLKAALNEMNAGRQEFDAAETPAEKQAARARMDAARTQISAILPTQSAQVQAQLGGVVTAIDAGDPTEYVVREVLKGVDAPDMQAELTASFEEIKKQRQILDDISADRGDAGYVDEQGRLTDLGINTQRQAMDALQVASDRAKAVYDAGGSTFLATNVDESMITSAQANFEDIASKLKKKPDGTYDYITPLTPEGKERVNRSYARGQEATDELINQFYGDKNSVKKLGEGGFALVKALEYDALELDRLVEQAGGEKEFQTLLGGTGDDAENARSLVASIAEQEAEIGRRFKDDAIHGMTFEEGKEWRENLATFREKDRRGNIARDIVELAGGDPDKLRPEQLADIESRFGKKEDLRDIEVATQSTQEIRDLAEKAGMTTDELLDVTMTGWGVKRDEFLKNLGTSEEELEQLTTSAGEFLKLGAGKFAGVSGAEAALEEMGRGQDFIDRQEQDDVGEFGPLLEGLERLMGNLRFDVAELVISGDGSAKFDGGGPDDSPVSGG